MAYRADPLPQESFSGTLLGHFEGGTRDDILQFAYNGHALERFALSSDFGRFNGVWSQQNML